MSTHPAPLTFDYAVVDVFAEQPLEGNALAIFTDANGLCTEDMQRIARETNLSETTFVLPRSPEIERERGVHVRIFTTEEELPFAGHPTLGTAAWLHGNHPQFRGAETIHLDLQAGRIPVTFQAPQPGEAGIFGTMRQNDPVFGDTHDPHKIAAALNLTIEDLDLTAPIQTVSTGMPFCIVLLRSLEVASRLQIPQHIARAHLSGSDAKFFFCITRASPGGDADWHARMQFYNGEDPAQARPQAAPSRGSFVIISSRAGTRSFSSRESRCFVRAVSTSKPLDATESRTCSSAAAPFPWHLDIFSCRNTRDIHNAFTSHLQQRPPLPHAAQSASKNFGCFRLSFAVANLYARSYSELELLVGM